MKKHIATYHIESQNLKQTIALLYDIYQRTGQSPLSVITDTNTYRWDKVLAHKLATNAINENDYAAACQY